MSVRMMTQRCRWLFLLGMGAFTVIIAVFAVNDFVAASTKDQIYDDPMECPEAPVALLLGVAKFAGKYENHFYRPRIRAAAELFLAGRVRGIIISGDNSRVSYNEPEQMKADLVELGVPESFLTCDYAGFRTLDSVIRVKEIFGQSRFIIVSQRFHCERALFLANNLGCEAWGYQAKSVGEEWGQKMRDRELLARAAAIVDLVIGRSPKYLGETESVHLKDAEIN